MTGKEKETKSGGQTTTMNSEIYDALTAAEMRSELVLLRWMAAANLTLSVAILAKLFVR